MLHLRFDPYHPAQIRTEYVKNLPNKVCHSDKSTEADKKTQRSYVTGPMFIPANGYGDQALH